MRVIGYKTIAKFRENHADARSSVDNWYKVASSRDWDNFMDLKQVFGSADAVDSHVVLNIGGNKYRLIADVNYKAKTLLVRDVITHKEYDRGSWKKS